MRPVAGGVVGGQQGAWVMILGAWAALCLWLWWQGWQ